MRPHKQEQEEIYLKYSSQNVLDPHQTAEKQVVLRIAKLVATVLLSQYKKIKSQTESSSAESSTELNKTDDAGINPIQIFLLLEPLINRNFTPNLTLKNELEFLKQFLQIPRQHEQKITQTELTKIYVKIEQIINWLFSYIFASNQGYKQKQKQGHIDKTLDILLNILQEKSFNCSSSLHNGIFLNLIKTREMGWTNELRSQWVKYKKQLSTSNKLKLEDLIQKRISFLEDLNSMKNSPSEPPEVIDSLKKEPQKIKQEPKPQLVKQLKIQQKKIQQTHCQPRNEQHDFKKIQRTYRKYRNILALFEKNFQVKKDLSRNQIVKTVANYQLIFMKNFLKKVLSKAFLRNPRHNSADIGNQLKYFNPNNSKVSNLLISKTIIERQTAFKNFSPELPNRTYQLLTYPSKLRFHQKLKNSQLAEESLQISKIQKDLQSVAKHNATKTIAVLKYLVDQDTRGAHEDIEEEAIVQTKRLKITTSMIKDVLLEDYTWMFAAECSFYH